MENPLPPPPVDNYPDVLQIGEDDHRYSNSYILRAIRETREFFRSRSLYLSTKIGPIRNTVKTL